MITIYGSAMCPDCQNCKYNFDKYGVEYKFLDVPTNLQYLNEFLYYRDTNPVFDRLKKVYDICYPACIDEDGTVFTDWETYLRNKGLEPVYLA